MFVTQVILLAREKVRVHNEISDFWWQDLQSQEEFFRRNYSISILEDLNVCSIPLYFCK